MRILVQLGRYGDIMGLLPMLYADAQRGERSAIMVSKQFADLIDGCSYVDRIVFNGSANMLERAVIEARSMSSDVRVAQVIGPKEEVKQYAFQPANLERAVTESFAKESWRLLGRLKEWGKHPLVFDQRDKQREQALIPRGRKKLILVAAGGVTSPFPWKPLLMELLKNRFRNYRILDISDLKAERIYDLLGLYEAAHCLVATDSAPLHLAAAVKLPVVALVNDTPSYWHGSPWRPNYISYIRYGDFPNRALSMLDAIEGIGGSGCYFRGQPNPKVVHVWSGYETEEVKNRQYPDGWVSCRAEFGTFNGDSVSRFKDPSRFPFLKDVIRIAGYRANDDDVICLTRGDTEFKGDITPELFNGPVFAHRTSKGFYHPAIDLVAFTKKWWIEHGKECPDFILNRDVYWGRVLSEVIKRNGGRELPLFTISKAA